MENFDNNYYNNNTNNENYHENLQNKNNIHPNNPASLLIMRSEMYIVYNYPNLVSINQKLLTENINDIVGDNSTIYIIKSFTEEDIHKAIKYNIWSSTNFGNTKLNNDFKQIEEENKKKETGKSSVFLLFSAYKTNQFTGLARMKSEVDFKNTFPLWARDNWKGTFEIEWLLIKDVPFKEFKDVTCEVKDKKNNGEYNFINYSIKSLINCPDCQQIPFTEGKEIINIMNNFQFKNSILEHFEYYDTRQANYEKAIKSNMEVKNLNKSHTNYSNYGYNNNNNYNRGGYNKGYNKHYKNKNYYNNNYNNNNKGYGYNNWKVNNYEDDFPVGILNNNDNNNEIKEKSDNETK